MNTLKKLTSALLVFTFCMICIRPSVAVANTTEVTTEQNAGMAVDLEIPSTFNVKIPKTLTIDSQSRSAEYTVYVSGDLKANELLYVIPTNTVTLVTEGKNNIIANVTQEKDTWYSAELSATEYIETTGKIYVPEASAGVWSGTVIFSIGTMKQ